MQYREYGTGNPDTLIFLHGGGLSWWNYREAAEMLQDRYRVILPILDGHAGSDSPFTSIEDNAEKIIAFIDEQPGGRVLLMGGLSLGAQILLEILAQRGGICRHAVVESAMVIPSSLTHAMIGPAFGSSYGLIQNRKFAKLQFQSLHMKPELFEDYYRDTCQIRKEDMISFLRANTAYALKDTIGDCTADVRVFVGQKETAGIRKSAEQIRRMIPGADLHVLPGLYHGEFSINHPEDYVKAIRSILNGKQR